MILDSSVIIGLERAGTPLRELAVPTDQALHIAAITVSEILVGALLADSDARRSERISFLDDVLMHVEVLPFRELEARQHAESRVALRLAGQNIGAVDLMIAATALANGHDVLTANVREFERVPGLRVITLDELDDIATEE